MCVCVCGRSMVPRGNQKARGALFYVRGSCLLAPLCRAIMPPSTRFLASFLSLAAQAATLSVIVVLLSRNTDSTGFGDGYVLDRLLFGSLAWRR